MSCYSLNSGYNPECPKDSRGGLRFVRIALLDYIQSIEEVGGQITKIVMKPGKAFFGFNFPKNTSSFTIKPSSNDANGSFFYDERLTLVMNKISPSTSMIFEALVRNPLAIIAEDNNGNSFLFGRTLGMTVDDGSVTSGVARADRNGYEVTFKGDEAKLSHMAANYILQQQGACFLVDRSGSRFVDRTGGGIYIPCDEPTSEGEFALIEFSPTEFLT